MIKFELKVREVHDLGLVCNGIIDKFSKDMPFPDIVQMHHIADSLFNAVDAFSKNYDKLSDLRGEIMKSAQKKVTDFKSEQIKKNMEGDQINPGYKELVQQFANEVFGDSKRHIDEELNGQFKELYDGAGEEKVTFELANEKTKLLIDNFEKYAKELYTDKKAMIKVYEVLTSEKEETKE